MMILNDVFLSIPVVSCGRGYYYEYFGERTPQEFYRYIQRFIKHHEGVWLRDYQEERDNDDEDDQDKEEWVLEAKPLPQWPNYNPISLFSSFLLDSLFSASSQVSTLFSLLFNPFTLSYLTQNTHTHTHTPHPHTTQEWAERHVYGISIASFLCGWRLPRLVSLLLKSSTKDEMFLVKTRSD